MMYKVGVWASPKRPVATTLAQSATRNSSARFAAVRHSRVLSEPDGELKFTSVVTLEVAARFFGPSPPELELQRSPAREVVPDAQSPAHVRSPSFQVVEVGVALVEVCPFGPPVRRPASEGPRELPECRPTPVRTSSTCQVLVVEPV